MIKSFSVNPAKDSFLVRADARVKLLSGLSLLLMVLSYRGFAFPLFVASLCLFLCLSMRMPLKSFALRFSEPAFIALTVVLLKFFFTGNDVVFSVEIFGVGISGHRDGLMEGLLIASRIAGAVSVVNLLGFVTPFSEFMSALSWMRMPKGLVEVSLLAYRYIFLLFDDAAVIYNAQRNRMGYSSMRRGLKSFGILAGSLVLKAFENSQQTATAMVQRGYDGDMPMLRHKSFRAEEVAVSALFIAFMGLAWRM